MRRFLLVAVAVMAFVAVSCNGGGRTLKVMQFNVWQEGSVIAGGFEAMADEIVRADADFVTLSEVRNYGGTRFCDRIVAALAARGHKYHSFYSYDSGLLSRYPIIDSATVFPHHNDHGTIYKLVADVEGREVAVYTAHLDYLNCAYYDARGYDGSSWARKSPVTDVDTLLELNRRSLRDDAIRNFIADSRGEIEKGRIVFMGGDLNEPSHLDWTDATKEMRDHQGMVVRWDVTSLLDSAGFVDCYRQIFPDPVTHPGFTFPADSPGAEVSRLTWAPLADERERIDYIFYHPAEGLTLDEVTIIGPRGDILRNERVVEQTPDPIIEPLGVWPTDHKALLAVFTLK